MGTNPFGELPDPRDDGKCSDCTTADAETRDGRFCKKCLRVRINRSNWIVNAKPRRSDQKQALENDPSPWRENAVRQMEDG